MTRPRRSPFGRASRRDIRELRLIVTAVAEWERSTRVPATQRHLPRWVAGVRFGSSAQELIREAQARAWHRIRETGSYDLVRAIQRDLDDELYHPELFELRKLRDEVISLRWIAERIAQP